MTIWICRACGIEHRDTPEPPAVCAICTDDRQYVPPGGQQWTTHEALRADHHGAVAELEPDLFSMICAPGFAIGHRGLLVRTPAGNLLWEPPGFLADELVEGARDRGGVAAIAASHPHLTGCSVSWSREFGGAPIYHAGVDQRWIRRPDPAIRLYRGTTEVLPGVTLVPCGGHFPGSSVLHWAVGAGGRGVLLTGDTIMVNPTRTTVSFMRSYPNLIPLPERLVRQVVGAVQPLSFDRIYGGFEGLVIRTGAAAAVQQSAHRYLGWLRDEIRDPDDAL